MLDRREFLSGACAAPFAGGAYAQALAEQYGRPLDPARAHRAAQAECRRLHLRIAAMLRRMDPAPGTVADRLRRLAADPRWLFPDSDAGRDAATARMNAALAAIRPKLSHAFDLPLPLAEVRRMSPADEAAGRGGYRAPEAYYVDLSKIRRRPGWTLATVAFHETVPGHRLQADFTAGHPPAFPEAWATYAEALCARLGAYVGDPMGELGFIQWRLFRMARVVADTGMGALGWTRPRAVAAMRDLQGFDIAFVTIEADVDRMAARPAVYAAQGALALRLSGDRPRSISAWPAWHRRVLTGEARTPEPGRCIPAPPGRAPSP